MAGPIFDSHAHYQSHQFDGDREALLRSLPAAGAILRAEDMAEQMTL